MNNQQNYNTIPTDLASKPQWVYWKYQTIDGEVKKPPVNTNGYKINCHNSDDWLSFQQVLKGLNPKKHEGIGFVLDQSGYIGVDVDDCFQNAGDTSSLKEWTKPLLDKIKGNYSEISPSGEGLKIVIKGERPSWLTKTKQHIGDGKIEIFDYQYFTITGNVIDHGNSSSDKQDQINSLCHHLFPEQSEQEQPLTPSTITTGRKTSGIDLQKRLEKARHEKGAKFTSLFDQGDISQCDNDHSKADFALCQKLAFWLERDEALIDEAFRQSKLYRKKWDDKHQGDGSTYGQMTIKKAISRTSEIYQGKAEVKTQATIPRSAPTAFEVPKDYLMGSDHYYAELVVKRFGQDIRWCVDMERWLVWNGKQWLIGKDHLVFKKVEGMVKSLKEDIFTAKEVFMDNSEFDEKDLKRMIDRATKFGSLHRQKAVLEYIKRFLPIEARDLDLDIYLLNFENCTVDLRTGEQLSHNREDYITKLIPHDYNPKAKAERWVEFVDQIMASDSEMVDYLQQAMGYACNGSTDEQILFMLYGVGANGKSTFCEAILGALGEYGKTVADDFFVAKYQREHPTEIADLQGSRLVIGSEFQGAMDEGKVKRLTGSDKLKARFMRGDMFEFEPTQTYFVCVNNRPRVNNTDDGIWRRVKLVPFTQKFAGNQRDKHLPKTLKTEQKGILAWLVEGAVKSFQEGINEPDKVTIASQEYREEFDIVGRFIDECCIKDISNKTQSSELYKAYTAWCKSTGEYCHSTKQFATELQRQGFEKRKSGYIWWQGITLNAETQLWIQKMNDNGRGWEDNLHKGENFNSLGDNADLPPKSSQPSQNKHYKGNEGKNGSSASSPPTVSNSVIVNNNRHSGGGDD